MTRARGVRARGLFSVATVLKDVYARATSTLFGDRIGLYLVRLSEVAGFALAASVHEAMGGPDPGIVLGRALESGVSEPLIAGSVPVHRLASILEHLTPVHEADRVRLARSVREVHASGEVPIVLFVDEVAMVANLSALTDDDPDPECLSWTVPSFGGA
ncbi:MAG: hypothetical protein R3F14_38405 [Polyangiaceae bacterium]